jgi:hypothetical protein
MGMPARSGGMQYDQLEREQAELDLKKQRVLAERQQVWPSINPVSTAPFFEFPPNPSIHPLFKFRNSDLIEISSS